MEVTALCLRLTINVLMVQYCVEQADAAFIQIAPNKLQFFEYESITIDCAGFNDSTQWRVLRRIMGVTTTCSAHVETTTRQTCRINHLFEADSGEYWCEADGKGGSNSVTVSVTAGPVILESPAHPALEGENVTLSCRQQPSSSPAIADFYKDGAAKWVGYDGKMIIRNVSGADAGLYKCAILSHGESAESWLAVREKRSPHHRSPDLLVLTVAVVLSLLVLLLGLGLYAKRRDVSCPFSKASAPGARSEPGVCGLTPTPVISQSTTDECVCYYTID